MARQPDAPLVSIVTPSYNQGRFIGHAIDSVLSQSYPHIEYLVMDGGSTDETVDVLHSYGDQVRWTSGPDGGQSDAIDNGFRRSRGQILAWLNADDVYAPGAVEQAVREFERHPETGLVYGQGTIIDAAGAETGPFIGIEPFCLWRLLNVLDYVLQPATFFRRSTYEATGGLDRELCYSMDWDLWIRLAALAEVRFVDRVLASSREWEDTKTATGGWRRIRELAGLIRRHTGRGWSPGVRLYALDTLRRQLRSALPPLAGPVDSVVAFASRRIIQAVPVHADGWLGPRSSLVVPRRWQACEVELEVHQLPPSGRFEVRFEVAGRSLGGLTADTAGPVVQRLELPEAADGPFRAIEVVSDDSFRSAGDPRRLSLRCVGIRPCEAA